MFVKDSHSRLLCTVIKLHVVEKTNEAKEAVLYFGQDF